MNFTADEEFRELLEEVRALVSHAEPRGDLLTVMKRGLEALRGELLKKKFGVGRKARRVGAGSVESRGAPEGAGHQSSHRSMRRSLKRSRSIAAAVAREVYLRDGGRCTFGCDQGRRCGERRLLQLDHVIPFAEGGAAAVDNLRLRCRAHNLHMARLHFGRDFVAAAVHGSAETTRGHRCREGRCDAGPEGAPKDR